MNYQNYAEQEKVKFSGMVMSVQVRSTVWRYVLDNRTHREIGDEEDCSGVSGYRL